MIIMGFLGLFLFFKQRNPNKFIHHFTIHTSQPAPRLPRPPLLQSQVTAYQFTTSDRSPSYSCSHKLQPSAAESSSLLTLSSPSHYSEFRLRIGEARLTTNRNT